MGRPYRAQFTTDSIPYDHGMFLTIEMFVLLQGNELQDQDEDIPDIGIDHIIIRLSIMCQLNIGPTAIDSGLH